MKIPIRFALVFLIASVSVAARAQVGAPRSSDTGQPAQVASQTPPPGAEITIPGPLRSFERMAAISQQESNRDVVPMLARDVVVNGYRGSQEKANEPTEYLILLRRYLGQARELQTLAGPERTLRVANCDAARPLLLILGYELHNGCGAKAVLETSDPDRAFVTIDSGFPLAQLEEALRDGKPFNYPYAPSAVPILFSDKDWSLGDKAAKSGRPDDLLDLLVRDPLVARLYWALSRVDMATRDDLRQSVGLRKLLPYAPILDFYGSDIEIRSGRAVVPGGTAAEPAWASLVGVNPASGSEFFVRLIAKDEGWMAAYYQALSRVNGTQQAYFTDPQRLRRFYDALRGDNVSPSPARNVYFRPDPGLLLLVTRLRLDANGQPQIPGDVPAWKDILARKYNSKMAGVWAKRAGRWDSPEQVVEGMVGLSRVQSESGPLRIFLALNEIDRGRPAERRLNPQTVRLLADKFGRFGNQYITFSEFGGLDNASIVSFLGTAQAIDHISDPILRANTVGIFQANLGLWEILARQRQISPAALNDSWQRVIHPFGKIASAAELFDATQMSYQELSRAVAGRPDLSEQEMITMLAGPAQTTPEAQQVRQEVATRIRSVMEAQRLVSLDTLFSLGTGLTELADGGTTANSLIPLAGELREFEMPRPLFTSTERNEWGSGFPNGRHAESETHTDLTKIIKSPTSPHQLNESRGQLTSFLRDSLVGLNYAYYEPPGAEMLQHNPLFVRFHDFSGDMSPGGGQTWQTPSLYGRGWAAGGGAHLAGSLADLPYVLAQTEQDFIVPENVQALVWDDLVPSLLSSAVLPRWWGVSRNELHAVALYQRSGEELLAAAADHDAVRAEVMDILSNRMLPQRAADVESALQVGHKDEALSLVAPAETFYLAIEYRRRFPDKIDDEGAAGKELETLSRADPDAVRWEKLSDDFGVPHPVLTQNYSRELLNLKPFPAFQGYSSRLMAESWDSSNLYWARLADEEGYVPEMLNRLVPELTRRMVEKIFASHFEDWSAVLRAMRETGEEFRQGKVVPLPKRTVASGM